MAVDNYDEHIPYHLPGVDPAMWGECKIPVRTINKWGLTLVGGIVMSVQRGTMFDGVFREIKTPFGQEYLASREQVTDPLRASLMPPKSAFVNTELLGGSLLQLFTMTSNLRTEFRMHRACVCVCV